MIDRAHRQESSKRTPTPVAKAAGSLLLLALLVVPVRPARAQAGPTERGGKLSPLQVLQTAHTYFAQGDYESARKYYLQVLPAFSKNFDVFRNLAFCYYSMGRAGYAQAARYYSRAYQIDPSSKDVAEKLSICLLALRRPGEAAEILRNLAEMPNAPPEAWKRVAEAFDDADKATEAEAAYDAYLQRKPGDLAARTQLGVLYGRQKEYPKAMEQLRMALSANPNYSPALIGMGRILSWQGQYEESLALYDRVLRLNPSNGEALSGKAFVLLWMGRPEEAEPLFSKLHERYPQDVEVARGLEAAQAAIEQKIFALARRSGNVARIEALYRQRLAKDAKDLEALKALVALTSDPNRCAESIGFARRALDLSPDDVSLELSLARSLTICQQFAEAIARYKRYLEARPKDEEALYRLSQTLLRARRIPEAMQVFRDLLQLNPRNQDASLGLAQTLAASGNYQEALVRYDDVLKASPDNYDALQGKAFVLFWTEQFAQARAIFENLAAVRPSDPQNTQALEDIARAEEGARWAALRPPPGAPPKDFVAYYEKRLASYADDAAAMKGLAYSQAQLNNLPAAIEGYERVLDKNPEDLDAQKELARLLSQDGRYDASLRLYQGILKNHPDDTASLESLARVYLWSKQPDKALPIYGDLLAKEPSNASYRMQVARLELQLKNYPAAREALASVLSAAPENREARLALAQLDFSQGRREESLRNFDQLLKQDPRDPDALLGKAQISYYQGNMPQAQAAATAAVSQRPRSFDTVFLLANIEHARGHRRQTKELLNQAEQISPGNPEVGAMKKRLREESAVSIHTSASYGREIGPSSEVATGGIGFLPVRISGGLPNEDLRLETYSTTIGFSLLPRVDSYFTFTTLPTQSPPLPIRDAQGNQIPSPITGAVAPWIFVSRHSWRLSRYLTIRGGAGVARFGPPEVERSPFLDLNLSDIATTFGAGVLRTLGINPERTETFEFKPVGIAGLTVAPSKKFSIDLDWTRSPAVYLPTPFSVKRRLTQTRFSGGLNFFFTPRTEVHFDFFYTRLFTDAELGFRMENRQLVSQPLSAPCVDPTPVEVFVGTLSRQCLGGKVIEDRGIRHDWGHGGAITFNQNIVHSERFSLDGGYRGILYGYAGRQRNVFLGFFNPTFYQNHQITGRIYGKLFGPLGYDFSGGIGLQQTNHGTPRTRSSTVTPSFSFKVSPHLTLGIAYTHYNTAQVLGPLRGNSVRLTTDWTAFPRFGAPAARAPAPPGAPIGPAPAQPGVPTAQAPSQPRVEIFGGFSYFRAGISNGINLVGWQASPDFNVHKNVAIVLDFGGQYKRVFGTTLSLYEYMAGPRFKYRTHRVTAFAHGLVGGEAAHAVSSTRGAFALGFGGGLDVNVSDRFAVRVFQIDSIHDHSGGVWGHNLRGGVGLVIKVGSRK